MRILIDHGQYDHLNIGDVAMLQACVSRLRREWPNAELFVITNSPTLLKEYCPDAIPVSVAYAQVSIICKIPRSARVVIENTSKIAMRYISGLYNPGRRRISQPRSIVQAVRAADLVVASGGGYITDKWSRHSIGVLAVLRLAQCLGKPTAMFGQGLGPITQPKLKKYASRVLPGLAVLGLREDQTGKDLALSLGAISTALVVTGDDALELVSGDTPVEGQALGVNMRVADYAGVDSADAKVISEILLTSAASFGVPIVALPISRQPADSDLTSIDRLLEQAGDRVQISLNDLPTTDVAFRSAGACRVIVTGSYHAAVFGLAQGVPAVCLSKSSYYDAKFLGLKALFPTACFTVPLKERDLGSRLQRAINDAWRLPESDRAAASYSAGLQREAGNRAYALLGEQLRHEAKPKTPALDRSLY